jgi:hypothetical protein
VTSPGKVGVLTFHKCINYGSYWQARCLAEGLPSRGLEVTLLDYQSKAADLAELRCAFQPRLPERSSRPEMRRYAAKIRKFAAAIAALPLSRGFPLASPDALPPLDTLVVGSDEVWNLAHPWYGGEKLFYGVGVRSPRLVSYAASFGSYSCHWGIHDYWAKQLTRFDSISVRDENSYWLIHGSTGTEPQLVLDPCLQFPEAISRAGTLDSRPYLLVYGHGFPDALKAAARTFADKYRLRLVSIGYRNGFADEQLLDAGPIEFARTMAGARAVVTNFFHGCVFSLVNSKPFATAVSDYRSNKIRDLMNMLGLGGRIVDSGCSKRRVADLLSSPPPASAGDRLAELRVRSDRFLNAALS